MEKHDHICSECGKWFGCNREYCADWEEKTCDHCLDNNPNSDDSDELMD